MNTPITVFLERQSYRRRRLVDALRLLPVIGALLFAIPLLWPNPVDTTDPSSTVSMSKAITYVFSAWAGLIIVTAVLSWRSRQLSQEDLNDDLEEAR